MCMWAFHLNQCKRFQVQWILKLMAIFTFRKDTFQSTLKLEGYDHLSLFEHWRFETLKVKSNACDSIHSPVVRGIPGLSIGKS